MKCSFTIRKRHGLFLAVCVGLVGCTTLPRDTANEFGGIITAELVNQHLGKGSLPASKPDAIESNGSLELRFEQHCRIKVSRGGSLLSGRGFERDRKDSAKGRKFVAQLQDAVKSQSVTNGTDLVMAAVVVSLLAGDEKARYPEIGLRAIHTTVWDGETLVFTTSDEKYDVEITRILSENAQVNIEALARAISTQYDKLSSTSKGK